MTRLSDLWTTELRCRRFLLQVRQIAQYMSQSNRRSNCIENHPQFPMQSSICSTGRSFTAPRATCFALDPLRFKDSQGVEDSNSKLMGGSSLSQLSNPLVTPSKCFKKPAATSSLTLVRFDERIVPTFRVDNLIFCCIFSLTTSLSSSDDGVVRTSLLVSMLAVPNCISIGEWGNVQVETGMGPAHGLTSTTLNSLLLSCPDFGLAGQTKHGVAHSLR